LVFGTEPVLPCGAKIEVDLVLWLLPVVRHGGGKRHSSSVLFGLVVDPFTYNFVASLWHVLMLDRYDYDDHV
jgi:hypothetical protein